MFSSSVYSSSSSFSFSFSFDTITLKFDLGFPSACQRPHFLLDEVTPCATFQSGGPGFDFVVCIPWESGKFLASPPYHLVMRLWLLCLDLSSLGDPTSSDTLPPAELSESLELQSSSHGLTWTFETTLPQAILITNYEVGLNLMALLQMKEVRIFVEIICSHFVRNGDDVHGATFYSYEGRCFRS